MDSNGAIFREYLHKQEDLHYPPDSFALWKKMEFFCGSFDLVTVLWEMVRDEGRSIVAYRGPRSPIKSESQDGIRIVTWR